MKFVVPVVLRLGGVLGLFLSGFLLLMDFWLFLFLWLGEQDLVELFKCLWVDGDFD